MKLSGRETTLLWLTIVVVMLGGTYWFAEPRVKEWKESNREIKLIEKRLTVTEHQLKQRDKWNENLGNLLGKLPRHPAEKDVTAELLKTLEQTARQHGLNLLKRDPDNERNLGDLYEVAIHCRWEAELEPLVRFLYAIQEQGVILDIRHLTVGPKQGQPGTLKGNFTVDVAYTREGTGTPATGGMPAAN